MRLRDRIADWIADWISGGEITVYRNAYKEALHRYQRVDLDRWEYKYTLQKIAAMETKGGNATVRRMARTANKALEDAR